MVNANVVLSKLLSYFNQVLPEETPYLSPKGFILPKTALVVPSKFIGDNILLLPFLKNLRAGLGSEARIDLVVPKLLQDFYEALPEVDRVYVQNSHLTRDKKTFLKTQQYDTLFLCHYSYTWAQAALHAEVPQRIGFDLERLGIHRFKRWGRSLSYAVPSTSALSSRHQVEVYLDILRHLGLPIIFRQPEYPLDPLEESEAARFFDGEAAGRSPRILIQASAKSHGKDWPAENWHQVLSRLYQQYQPLFVSMGSQKERPLYAAWESEFPWLNLCGKTSLRESLALLRQVDMVITLDTATAHMAALAGTARLIVIYGPTNHIKWQPRIQQNTLLKQVFLNLPCRPCLARTCEQKSCLLDLSADRVMENIKQAWAEKPLTSTRATPLFPTAPSGRDF